jgi:methionyl-tRNA formyltransferase
MNRSRQIAPLDKRRPRVIVIGNGTIAVRGLYILRDLAVDTPLVIADSQDSGSDSWSLSLMKAAAELGYQKNLTLLNPKNPNTEFVLDRIKAANPDFILSLQCRRILRYPILGIPRYGVINLHNSPLPLLRGCDPFPGLLMTTSKAWA